MHPLQRLSGGAPCELGQVADEALHHMVNGYGHCSIALTRMGVGKHRFATMQSCRCGGLLRAMFLSASSLSLSPSPPKPHSFRQLY